VPADAIAAGHTLLTHELAVHGVEGHAPGLYEWVAGRAECRRAGLENEVRDVATYLCVGQPLGGDSAFTVFESADLDAVLDTLGPRGYRAAHLEAGIVNGRLLLAAHALGLGATGLTFFDDAVDAAFATRASCLLVTAVGVPTYRPIPGGQPGRPTELVGFEALMARLADRFRQQPRRSTHLPPVLLLDFEPAGRRLGVEAAREGWSACHSTGSWYLVAWWTTASARSHCLILCDREGENRPRSGARWEEAPIGNL
jgi:hypothetical protein